MDVATDDLLVLHSHQGRVDVAGHQAGGVGEVAEVVGAALGEGERDGRGVRPPPGPPRPLEVVGRGGRDIAHQDDLQAAQVHAQFKGGGATEDIDLAPGKAVLDFACLFGPPLGGVLLGPEGDGEEGEVEVAVMVLPPRRVVRAYGLQRAIASVGGADAAQAHR